MQQSQFLSPLPEEPDWEPVEAGPAFGQNGEVAIVDLRLGPARTLGLDARGFERGGDTLGKIVTGTLAGDIVSTSEAPEDRNGELPQGHDGGGGGDRRELVVGGDDDRPGGLCVVVVDQLLEQLGVTRGEEAGAVGDHSGAGGGNPLPRETSSGAEGVQELGKACGAKLVHAAPRE